MFSWNIDTEIFAEGFRDKIFDTEIVAALGRTLSNEFYFGDSAVKFFIAAMAQSALHSFHVMITLKYSQRGFGTRYLAMR